MSDDMHGFKWMPGEENVVLHPGLKEIYIDNTKISYIDGDKGRLYYRGYSIETLVENSTFEEVVFLLIHGHLPSRYELFTIKDTLRNERDLPDRVLMILKSFPRETTRIEILRTIISALALFDPDDYDYSTEANIRKGLRIIAKIPTIMAYSHRIKSNLPIIEPDPELSHAGNFYYMVTGNRPDKEIEKAFDKALILQSEHGSNASSFAARVTVSTLSDIYSAVVSAIGALRGPLHGGANERVILMLKEIGEPEKTEEFIMEKLNKHERIMGFGHRIYKTRDPRADIYEVMANYYCEKTGNQKLIEISKKMCEVMMRERKLSPNVDFYSASFSYAIGLPILLFTPLFAASRSAGWVAQTLEQLENNVLIRPLMRYQGDIDRKYRPLDDR
ncbi:MAG: citrate synthase [Candidatus Lokiarchaeota archaeon]|nr:citrate synthase [Candidatus Lokiarchaeota archaeon]